VLSHSATRWSRDLHVGAESCLITGMEFDKLQVIITSHMKKVYGQGRKDTQCGRH